VCDALQKVFTTEARKTRNKQPTTYYVMDM
jgi:hypothetical protein